MSTIVVVGRLRSCSTLSLVVCRRSSVVGFRPVYGSSLRKRSSTTSGTTDSAILSYYCIPPVMPVFPVMR